MLSDISGPLEESEHIQLNTTWHSIPPPWSIPIYYTPGRGIIIIVLKI